MGGDREFSLKKRVDRAHSGIIQAGEKLLDVTRRSLPAAKHSVAPSKQSAGSRHLSAFPLYAPCGANEQEKLVEIVDSHDRPLLCMPPEEALRQGLSVRMVAVALFSRQGRLIVHKRPDDPGFTGRWDIEAGFVLAGEAREDAALRLIASCMNLHGLSVTPLSGGDGYGRLSPLFSLFIVRLPSGLYPKYAAQDMMMVDADELTGLIRDVPELLSPELLKAATVPGLFYAR